MLFSMVLFFLRGWRWLSVKSKLGLKYRCLCDVAKFSKDYDYTAWILGYFSLEEKYTTFPVVRPNFELTINDLHKTSTVELANFITDRKLKKKLVVLADLELTERVSEKTPMKEILGVLHSLVSNYKQYDLNFIKKVYPYIEQHVRKGDLSIYEQIQSMYYIAKYGSKSLGNHLSSLVLKKITKKELDLFNENDLAIFCLSSFSSSLNLADTTIPSVVVEQIKNDLNLTNPDSMFVFRLTCFIKCLRHAEYYDDELLDLLSWKLLNAESNLRDLPVTIMVHLLLYFCNAQYADLDFIYWFVRTSVGQIESDVKMKKRVRIKDLNNLLYAVSKYCDHEINKMLKNSFLPSHIHKTLNNGKVPLPMMVNMILSLWTVECDIKEATVEFITEKNINTIKGNGNFKHFYKLNLLLTCVLIECPNLLGFDVKSMQSNHLKPRKNKYLSKRPVLKKTLEYLLKNGHSYNLTDVQFSFQVPGLYIAGIRANHPSGQLNIEVIDNTVCLRKSSQPNGDMALKLRLLKKMNCKFIPLHLSVEDCLNQNLKSIDQQLKTALLSQ